MAFLNFLLWKIGIDNDDLHVMNSEDTYKYISKHKISVCRFGDGELNLIQKKFGPRFQPANPVLISRLKEILSKSEDFPQILICIPYSLKNKGREGLTNEAAKFWKKYKKKMPFDLYKMLCGKFYGDTQITRPYMDYEKTKRNKLRSAGYFSNLKSLWKDRKVLIVEGRKTRMGLNNDLFSAAKKIGRIICPEENAWISYDAILSSVEQEGGGYDIILCSLGPTATVLSFDLAKRGFWAIDIGHLDVEYEWFCKKSSKKEPVKYRYVNEVGCFSAEEVDVDNIYYEQIVCEVL